MEWLPLLAEPGASAGPDALGIFLRLLLVLFLVFLNGFFVASEFAIVKVRMTQIEALLLKGTMLAKTARHVVSKLDAYLSATQLGITLASLGLGWIGEPAVAKLIERPLMAVGIEGKPLHTIAFFIGFSIITFLHIVLGELAPKSVAIQRAQGTTLVISPFLAAFYFVSFPLIYVLNQCSNFILRLVGLRQVSELDLAYSEEELRLVLGRLSDTEITRFAKKLALQALELRNRPIREIIIPRMKIVYLDTELSIEENLKIARESEYSRFPLCEGNVDRVIGMVLLKPILWKMREGGGTVDLKDFRRDIIFFPETLSLEKALVRFLQEHCHMAFVLDEYGGTVGMVTLEDVLEELVGEIQDEFDQEVSPIQKLPDSKDEYLAEGFAPLYQINAVVGSNFEGEGVDTLSGYLVKELGRIPREGEEAQLGNFAFTMKKVGRRRIHQVVIRRSPESVRAGAPRD